MSFWKRDTRVEERGEERDALPIMSVNTEDEAKSLLVTYGKLGYDGIYLWPNFKGTVEAMKAAGFVFEEAYLNY